MYQKNTQKIRMNLGHVKENTTHGQKRKKIITKNEEKKTIQIVNH